MTAAPTQAASVEPPRQRPPRPSRNPLSTRRWIADLAAIALLAAVSIVGFAPSFAGLGYLRAALGALVLGLAIAAFGAWVRAGILTLTALTVGAYFLLGGALALPHTAIGGVIPTIETLRQLAVGVVTSWKSLLTTIAPVSTGDGHGLVPFILVLVCTVIAASLALRVTPPAWALLPMLVLLLVQITLGTWQTAMPAMQGVALAVVAVVWLALRDAWSPAQSAVSVGGGDEEALRSPGAVRRRVLAGGAVVAVGALAGAGAMLLPPQHETRQVLRDVIVPPFDIREYPSPLQSHRLYVRDFKESPLFTVEGGLPEDARIRLGVMDTYDGIVYSVSDQGTGESSAFTPLRSDMAAGIDGQHVTLDIEIDEYADVWIPDAGFVDEIVFHGDRAEELRRGTYYNPATGTAVATTGLTAGDSYTVEAVLPELPSDAELADADFGGEEVPEAQNVPEGLAELAADTVAEAETPIEKARALEAMLSEGGFFSHGLEGEAFSLPGHGSQRMATFFDGEQLVGDDEQYAVAMALLAGEIGIPARVVMGFHDDAPQTADEAAQPTEGDFVATGDNLHTWVEIPFEGYGWLPFDPTPPEDQEPQQETTEPKPDPKPQVVQPPPPPQEPVDLPPLIPDEREDEEENEPLWNVIGLVLGIAGISLLVVLLLMSPFIVIGLLKAARRRRRRNAPVPADRIAGGWEELMDRAADYGASAPVGYTRWEEAVLVGHTLEEPRMTRLAVRADASVFGPGEPSAIEIDAFWREVEEVAGGLDEKATFWRRTRARLNVRTLIAGSKTAARIRGLRERVAATRKTN